MSRRGGKPAHAIQGAVGTVTVIEHWLVLDPHPDAETFVVWDAEAADEYRRARSYRVDGPFVTADQLQGAVDENEKLRLQVSALENDGMELAAKLGEAE